MQKNVSHKSTTLSSTSEKSRKCQQSYRNSAGAFASDPIIAIQYQARLCNYSRLDLHVFSSLWLHLNCMSAVTLQTNRKLFYLLHPLSGTKVRANTTPAAVCRWCLCICAFWDQVVECTTGWGLHSTSAKPKGLLDQDWLQQVLKTSHHIKQLEDFTLVNPWNSFFTKRTCSVM